jgi:hypothetical protein
MRHKLRVGSSRRQSVGEVARRRAHVKVVRISVVNKSFVLFVYGSLASL